MVTIERVKSMENGKDNKAITEFILNFVKERVTSELPISVSSSKIAIACEQYVNDDSKIALIARDNDKVIGVYLGEVTPYSFSNELVLSQKVARIEKEYRGTGVGSQLFEALKEWGRSKGCRYVTAGIHLFGKYDVEASYRAFEKMGFKEFSRTYYMDL